MIESPRGIIFIPPCARTDCAEKPSVAFVQDRMTSERVRRIRKLAKEWKGPVEEFLVGYRVICYCPHLLLKWKHGTVDGKLNYINRIR